MASSASDVKKSPYYIKGKCLNDCEATLFVGEENTELYVCMDQLGQSSEFFRAMFFGDFKEKNENRFQVTDEKPDDIVHFFDVLIGTDRKTNVITDDSIELLIRLADKYRCDTLKEQLNDYIIENLPKRGSATLALNWLIWSLKYHMPQETIKVCVPAVACLPLTALSENEEKIGLELFAKLVVAKYKLLYQRLPSSSYCYNCCNNCPTVASVDYCIYCGKIDCLCDRKKYDTMLNQ